MSAENILTIIICVLSALVTSFATALITIRFNIKRESKEDLKDDTEKAIELAKYYATNMIPLIQNINYVYKSVFSSTLISKLNRRRQSGNLSFTYEEMEGIFEDKEIVEIKNCISLHQMPLEVLLNARSNLHANYINDVLFIRNEDVWGYFGEDFGKILYNQLCLEFNSNRMNLLNMFEFFAMSFNTKIADEQQVYQSLHQTYLAAMTYLYFDIASMNTDPKDKYFTNATQLFNLWNKNYNEKVKAHAQKRSEIEDSLVTSPRPYKPK